VTAARDVATARLQQLAELRAEAMIMESRDVDRHRQQQATSMRAAYLDRDATLRHYRDHPHDNEAWPPLSTDSLQSPPSFYSNRVSSAPPPTTSHLTSPTLTSSIPTTGAIRSREPLTPPTPPSPIKRADNLWRWRNHDEPNDSSNQPSSSAALPPPPPPSVPTTWLALEEPPLPPITVSEEDWLRAPVLSSSLFPSPSTQTSPTFGEAGDAERLRLYHRMINADVPLPNSYQTTIPAPPPPSTTSLPRSQSNSGPWSVDMKKSSSRRPLSTSSSSTTFNRPGPSMSNNNTIMPFTMADTPAGAPVGAANDGRFTPRVSHLLWPEMFAPKRDKQKPELPKQARGRPRSTARTQARTSLSTSRDRHRQQSRTGVSPSLVSNGGIVMVAGERKAIGATSISRVPSDAPVTKPEPPTMLTNNANNNSLHHHHYHTTTNMSPPRRHQQSASTTPTRQRSTSRGRQQVRHHDSAGGEEGIVHHVQPWMPPTPHPNDHHNVHVSAQPRSRSRGRIDDNNNEGDDTIGTQSARRHRENAPQRGRPKQQKNQRPATMMTISPPRNGRVSISNLGSGPTSRRASQPVASSSVTGVVAPKSPVPRQPRASKQKSSRSSPKKQSDSKRALSDQRDGSPSSSPAPVVRRPRSPSSSPQPLIFSASPVATPPLSSSSHSTPPPPQHPHPSLVASKPAPTATTILNTSTVSTDAPSTPPSSDKLTESPSRQHVRRRRRRHKPHRSVVPAASATPTRHQKQLHPSTELVPLPSFSNGSVDDDGNRHHERRHYAQQRRELLDDIDTIANDIKPSSVSVVSSPSSFLVSSSHITSNPMSSSTTDDTDGIDTEIIRRRAHAHSSRPSSATYTHQKKNQYEKTRQQQQHQQQRDHDETKNTHIVDEWHRSANNEADQLMMEERIAHEQWQRRRSDRLRREIEALSYVD
jgi:hypothetical protein